MGVRATQGRQSVCQRCSWKHRKRRRNTLVSPFLMPLDPHRGLSLADSLPGNGTAKEPGKCSSLRHKCTLSRGIRVAGTPGGSMWPVGQARQQPPEKEGVRMFPRASRCALGSLWRRALVGAHSQTPTGSGRPASPSLCFDSCVSLASACTWLSWGGGLALCSAGSWPGYIPCPHPPACLPVPRLTDPHLCLLDLHSFHSPACSVVTPTF